MRQGERHRIVEREFRPALAWIDGIFVTANDRAIDRVFEISVRGLAAEDGCDVRFVFRESRDRLRVGFESIDPEYRMGRDECRSRIGARDLTVRLIDRPRPFVTKPKLRHDVQGCRSVAAIRRDDAYECIGRSALGVFDRDIEVRAVVEDAGIDEFVLGLAPIARGVSREEIGVWKCGMWIFVQRLHIAMRRDVVEVIVELFYVLAVIALMPVEPEESLFEMRIVAIPKRGCETESLVVVADSEDSVFAPSIRVLVHARRENTATHRHRRCSLREPCPTGDRSGTGPSGSNARSARRRQRHDRVRDYAPSSLHPLSDRARPCVSGFNFAKLGVCKSSTARRPSSPVRVRGSVRRSHVRSAPRVQTWS